jgi:hypothetical protein
MPALEECGLFSYSKSLSRRKRRQSGVKQSLNKINKRSIAAQKRKLGINSDKTFTIRPSSLYFYENVSVNKSLISENDSSFFAQV